MSEAKKPKSFIHDDTGIAYGVYAVIAFILMAGTVVVWYIPMFNSFLGIFNNFIGQGMVSQDTSDAMEFNGFVITSMVAFILFGVACWGVVRALEKRKLEGY
jgi:hypothetical protein